METPKLLMETKNSTKRNFIIIERYFPHVITDLIDEHGKLKKGINFELLKQELSEDLVDGGECYDFTWVGKKASIIESNTPIRKTLRPCIEESKDWESTGNLYIEGDNLAVLKLLQESYLNSVKMIYIDPPYNTGRDFIYKDSFKIDKEAYDEKVGLYDEEERRLFHNTDTNGRFHSDWCSMIYPRIKLAHNLLREDGVIFISIDDNEVDNLRKMCSEVFGETNFIAQLPTIMNLKGNNDQFGFAGTHEYTVVYAKDKNSIEDLNGIDLTNEEINEYDLSDDCGKYKQGATLMRTGEAGARQFRPKGFYPIYVRRDLSGFSVAKQNDDDYEVFPRTREGKEMSWRRSKEYLMETKAEIIIKENNGSISFYKKQRLAEDMKKGKKPKTLFYKPEYSSGNGTAQIKELFKHRLFDNPKPHTLIKDFIKIGSDPDSIILDFFAGSSTTAHAVMQLNAEDGGTRKFIMVQLPEVTDAKSEAYKAGYKSIADIGKERIRRAGEKIKAEVQKGNEQLKIGEEPKNVPDIGFRVLKIDSTNMKDVHYAATEYSQQRLKDLESNIKEDRTDLDLLYGVLLHWGLPLSLHHRIEDIEGVSVQTVDEGSLIACFAEKIPEKVVKEIALRKPLRVVFRDSCFASSPAKINVEEIFKLLAPQTVVKVI